MTSFPTFSPLFVFVWLFVFIIKRTFYFSSKIWILCSSGKNNISNINFISSRQRVIYSLYIQLTDFVCLYITKRTFYFSSKIWILCSSGKNNISNINFISSRQRVISFIFSCQSVIILLLFSRLNQNAHGYLPADIICSRKLRRQPQGITTLQGHT